MDVNEVECLFCTWEDPTRHRIIAESGLAYARWNDFPKAVGHSLIIPKQHRTDFFDVTPGEMAEILALSKEVRILLDREYSPKGYNVISNVGLAAGQVIMHAHVHLLPRYDLDGPITLGPHH